MANGLHADVVNFSLEPDVERLVKAGMVSPSWNQNSTHGFVTNSVVVFIVRKGNPKHISNWPDLLKPGVQVLTPNPFTSGGARWNIMAAYGAQLKEGKTPAQAEEYLKPLFKNVVSQDTSARNALQTFLAGRGDVLIGYENEAITDEKKGAANRIRDPRGHDPDPEPRRGGRLEHGGDEASRDYLISTGRPGDLGRKGLPARDRRRSRGLEVPDPARSVHDRIARRLEEGQQGILRTRNGDRDEDRAVAWRLNLEVARRSLRCPPRRSHAAGTRARGRVRARACSAST